MSTVSTTARRGSGARRRDPAVLSLVGAGSAVALVAGVLAARAPLVTGATAAVAGLCVLVWRHPVVAAYLTLSITPLVAGIDRGRLIPVLRPNEALVAFLAVVVVVRAVVLMRPGQTWSWRPSRIEVALVAMAVANSLLPLLVMTLRGQTIQADDVSYALVLWKYLGVYALVRATVRTDRQIGVCLWLSILAAGVVGLLGALQALDLAGVREALVGYYAPYGYTGALAAPRGGSTLALPAATADLLILALVTAAGLWWKDRRHGVLLAVLGAVFVAGAFGAAEFSSTLGLLVAVVTSTWLARRLRLLVHAPAALVVAVVALWPVIEHRLAGFQSVSGLPVSWTTRWYNLDTYFIPELTSGTNPLFGVRPSARVVAEHQGTGFVWIENGYLWLFWGGGVPLFAAFVAFVWIGLRSLLPLARLQQSYVSVASMAAFVGIVVMAVLMVFDPHLTYRGAADQLFALLAMSAVALPPPPTAATPRTTALQEAPR